MKRGVGGFTLIEAVLVVLVISVTIPAGMRMVRAAERAQHESQTIYTATTVAGSIGEQILADVYATERFGPWALDDAAVYLDDPSDGLRARVDWLFSDPSTSSMSFDVSIGDLGVAPAPAGMRAITVRVEIQSIWHGTLSMPYQMLVRGE